MKDWITHVIHFYPDARQLEEHLRLQSWRDAYELSTTMMHDLAKLQMYLKENKLV